MDLTNILNQIIDKRFYELIKAEAIYNEDNDLLKMVEAIHAVSKKHNMTFKELWDIETEISMLVRTEE